MRGAKIYFNADEIEAIVGALMRYSASNPSGGRADDLLEGVLDSCIEKIKKSQKPKRTR